MTDITQPASQASDPDRLLSQLKTCRDLTRLAREHGAQLAAQGLTGARLARCQELVTKLFETQAHAERLLFVVMGDMRAIGGAR